MFIRFIQPSLEKGLGDVSLDSLTGLKVVFARVEGAINHSCPRFFNASASCDFGCNVFSECRGTFDMTAFEEEFLFMK